MSDNPTVDRLEGDVSFLQSDVHHLEDRVRKLERQVEVLTEIYRAQLGDDDWDKTIEEILDET